MKHDILDEKLLAKFLMKVYFAIEIEGTPQPFYIYCLINHFIHNLLIKLYVMHFILKLFGSEW